MKIVSVKVWREFFPLTRPYTIAFRTTSEVENIFIELHDETGEYGLGAASPEHHVTGETFDLCFDALAGFDPDLIKIFELPEQMGRLQSVLKSELGKTPAARAALDMAVYDLLAKREGLPLCERLGKKHERIATSITIGIKPVEEVLREADEYLGRGFHILKLKLGDDVETDIERTLRLREKVGAHTKIRIDINQGYSLEQLKTYLRRTASAGIEFMEQPLKVKDFHRMKDLPEQARKKIAADESLLSPDDARILAESGLCGIFNIKLMKCGGISPALEIANAACTRGVDLMWGCMDESRVSIGAALHTAFACENTRYLDLDGHLDLARDLVSGGFDLEDGWLSVTSAPGIGYKRL